MFCSWGLGLRVCIKKRTGFSVEGLAFVYMKTKKNLKSQCPYCGHGWFKKNLKSQCSVHGVWGLGLCKNSLRTAGRGDLMVP